MNYDLVCGMETHIELSTESKLFCPCKFKFGDSQNTDCCPICIGAPGTLPVLNMEAVKFAIRMGLALNCKINQTSIMERKCYFYPDLSKNFQTSQNDLPLCSGGFVLLDSGKKIRINHIHIEEDAGKIKRESDGFYVDYNRGGIPLIEIVSEPDISSVSEAEEYINKLQLFARYLRISSARMQEGSIRCDVNISVKPHGSDEFGTRIEIKNMNSISFICKALEYEYERQVDSIENGTPLFQETRRYNESTGMTEGMREKETATDYCYFPEPDLLNVYIEDDQLSSIKNEMPILFNERLEKYIDLGISEKIAKLLIKYVNISDFFDEIIKDCKCPEKIASLIVGPVFKYLKTESEKEDFNISISSSDFQFLGKLISENKISPANAQKAVSKCLENNSLLKDEISKFEANETFDLDKICNDVISQNSNAVNDYKNGKEKALQALVGKIMAKTKGCANPEDAKKTLQNLIEGEGLPNISVIVPVYNTAEYLSKCLDSLINQTYKDLEIILVNDGSIDNSLEILNEYAKKDRRIKVINKKHGGVSSARNAGLDISKGKYISFIDSDDYVDLNMYDVLVSSLENKDYTFLTFGYVNEPEIIKRRPGVFDAGVFDAEDFLCLQYPVGFSWNTIYRRSFINENNLRFAPGVSLGEDNLFMQMCILKAKNKKIKVISNKMYHHVNRGPGRYSYEQMLKSAFERGKLLLEFCESNKIFDRYDWALSFSVKLMHSQIIFSNDIDINKKKELANEAIKIISKKEFENTLKHAPKEIVDKINKIKSFSSNP